jgi:hypothetical protein
LALEINNPSEAALKVIKCYWDDLGCPEVPGEYNHNEIVVRVMRGDIEVAKGNPDAVVTAIRADFFANAPYLISSVASPAWSPPPGVAGNDSNQHQVQSRGETPPTRLSDLVTKSQSSRLQKLASLPKADQEAKVAQESSFAATSETADGGGTISTDDDDGGAKATEPGRGSEHETSPIKLGMVASSQGRAAIPPAGPKDHATSSVKPSSMRCRPTSSNTGWPRLSG